MSGRHTVGCGLRSGDSLRPGVALAPQDPHVIVEIHLDGVPLAGDVPLSDRLPVAGHGRVCLGELVVGLLEAVARHWARGRAHEQPGDGPADPGRDLLVPGDLVVGLAEDVLGNDVHSPPVGEVGPGCVIAGVRADVHGRVTHAEHYRPPAPAKKWSYTSVTGLRGGHRMACQGCTTSSQLDFDFSMAFQPIYDAVAGREWGYEAQVRGLSGEGAFEILSEVSAEQKYRFDQDCRVKAIELASRLFLAVGELML